MVHCFDTRLKRALFVAALIILTILCAAFSTPRAFPIGAEVVVHRGATASDISEQLATAGIVAYPTALLMALHCMGGSASIQAGTYRFDTPLNTLSVARRLMEGIYGVAPIRITFVEGITVRETAVIVAEAFPDISAEEFIATAKEYEGYLFPDTYLFPSGSTAESIVKTMRENFDAKVALLVDEIDASGHPLADVVTMASLIEKEARTTTVRRMVSGILWNRYVRQMPLQVDAVFGYIFSRDTYSPSYADLKVDSPYNTYTHIGLPPGPINNPGLDSIEAALNPTKTNYLYYLVDKAGTIHYATTYAEHLANQNKYLR